MIGVPIALLIVFVLLVLLLLVGARGASVAELPFRSDLALLEDGSENVPCPPEFAARIFSSQDSEFVAATHNPQLVELFRRERKIVALLWVQQTSAAIQGIMREHLELARRSENLQFTTEVKLALLYGELMSICGLLFIVIHWFGPVSLGSLATYADAHSRQFADVQQSFKAATSPRQLSGFGAS